MPLLPRLLRTPVAVFLATGVLALGAIVLGTSALSQRAAADEAVADAQAITEVLAYSVAEPALPPGLVDGEPGALDRFDRKVLSRLLVGDALRVKIWDSEGRIVYSDKTQLIGEVFPLGEDELDILRRGGTDAEVSDLGEPENRFEREAAGLLEVYTRIESPEGVPLLFETYFDAADVERRRDQVFAEFGPITLAALGLVVLVATGLLWVLTRRLRQTAEERERLLRVAADASEAERLRIARDLHDGVVQDLSGASFAVSALARDASLPQPARTGLDDAGATLRTGLRALRSLMVEIYPPDLRAEGLSAALEDLIAPAAAAGVRATVSVEDLSGVPDEEVRLGWRIAQEAVRNALRHSGAEHLVVTVARSTDGPGLRLEVRDDGRGFDPAARLGEARFGLRGMGSLVVEAGGELGVRSSPGHGTVVTLHSRRGSAR